ncbi:MAG: bifunctional DNA-formamidopyrimidine glycosylase/DNA-(apurinic or apyrimidinic site) lyase [Buchananella hordeovulneris]|nr:bifunctional DNA-formamidopyrimidine glycosylase/DNA-(apurinic or apyrimidinic site) lyase [Buchananella hordeovulneris]
MPELAEVETIRLGLAGHLLGARVEGLEALHPRVDRHGDLPYALAAGRRIGEIARRGKFLWCNLMDDVAGDATAPAGTCGVAAGGNVGPQIGAAQTEKQQGEAGGNVGHKGQEMGGAAQAHGLGLLFHLGMSGQLLVDSEVGAPDPERDRHLRARLVYSDDAGEHLLRFVDQRTFGYVSLCPLVPTSDGAPGGLGSTLPLLPSRAAQIARDALDPHLDSGEVARRIRASKTIIKSQLLDQAKISGIGNIYADEALARSGIHPTRPGNTLADAEIERLLAAAAHVLRAAIEAGGTSFDALYVDAAGNPGYFARELWAYGRAGQPCRRCGQELERAVLGGRSATYCPGCQK